MPISSEKEEILLSNAVEAYKSGQFKSIQAAASHFGASKWKLRNRSNGTPSKNGRTATNKALNQSQERSLIRWIELLNSVYTPPTALDIEGAANRILQHCGSDRQVSKMYGYQFIARLPPHITLRTQKPMEKARTEAELHGELVHWYKVFGQFLKKNKIQAHELYNWDETGFQLGVGTKENVASTRENETIATGGIGQNITGIECISADGWVMHPWFLMCGSEQMEDWFDGDNDPSNYRVIKPTAKGWTDDKTAIQWLLDFHYTTKKRVAKGRPRVLVMDNHGSHGTPEFEYLCQSLNIIPWWFIPKLTHRCQPLDGKPFSVLKQKFRKKNNEIVRWGGDVDDKRHFLRLIKTVRKDTFKSRTIKSSFYDTGIWPWNPHIVCDQIDPSWEDEPVLEIYGHTPSPEAEIPSSVTNSPPNSDQRFSKIENKLQTIFENDEPDLPKVQKHINRAIRGGKQAIQDLALAKQTIKKMQSHKIPVKRSKRIIKGASKSPLSSIAGNSRVHRRCTKETKLDIGNESAHARIRDYWLRANQALKEKEEASGGRDYLDVEDEVFKYVNIDSMVAEK
ncbi:transcriptional regulator family: Centromere protein B, DNA-binding region [Penicillium roqueforti]|nr:transcriptional regulator family: Centromere protein B, DNA-binding region [Penicillium roqueforti]KAI3149070.1 transcriptional regulator family: Centromere protein B, DNA-binding region [Penicillium roqueforti]KAI3226147.1 transcriptional regulator family: Centromere protein B, DNA-binding region [Penicillium roqueforti]KAI3227282.1 transcriptional regulator family: Centromere protein B, DNA-binding region [Penicillium roqueforti]